jgi:deazaflavin-dependent oxidoreductase (nitroreductase family)
MKRPNHTTAPVPRRSASPRLVLASGAVAAPGWIIWLATGRGADLLVAVATSMVLGANAVVTRFGPSRKRSAVRILQKYLLNPPIRVLVSLGALPLGYAVLETTGRISGQPRRVPVGSALVGDTFWVVAEHGRRADYVRNIERDPHVRLKIRNGLRPVWRQGTAHLIDTDDPHARQRAFSRWHPLRALNAAVVRVMGTELLTIRIDLEDDRA